MSEDPDDGQLHRCEHRDDDDVQCYKAGKWYEFPAMYLCEDCTKGHDLTGWPGITDEHLAGDLKRGYLPE